MVRIFTNAKGNQDECSWEKDVMQRPKAALGLR